MLDKILIPIEYRPGVNFQWIFRWIMTLLSCYTLNFDTFLSRNSTGRRYVDGSEFHVELWPRVKIPRWIMTRVRIPHWNVIPIPGFNLTWVTIQRGRKARCHNLTWNLDPGPNSTWNHDTGSQFNVELWPGVTISRWIMTRVIVPHWIMIQIPGHNWTLNHDSGSQFNVELWPGVTIQRGIKTLGHNSTGGS